MISPRKTIKNSMTKKLGSTLKDFNPKFSLEDKNHSPRVVQDGVKTVPRVIQSNISDKSARARVN